MWIGVASGNKTYNLRDRWIRSTQSKPIWEKYFPKTILLKDNADRNWYINFMIMIEKTLIIIKFGYDFSKDDFLISIM